MSDVGKKDIIKESLSLSKSGGIYFAGERVPADENQMVLFVGLGGYRCKCTDSNEAPDLQ